MANKVREALQESLQDLVDAGIKTTFTKKQLDEIGVVIPRINMSASRIKGIRKATNLSQSVFSRVLNVSLSSVRHWEQGIREPMGSTKVLLDLLSRNPHLLDHQLYGQRTHAA